MITTAEEGLLARQTIERYGEWGDSPIRLFLSIGFVDPDWFICTNQRVQQHDALHKYLQSMQRPLTYHTPFSFSRG